MNPIVGDVQGNVFALGAYAPFWRLFSLIIPAAQAACGACSILFRAMALTDRRLSDPSRARTPHQPDHQPDRIHKEMNLGS